MDRYGDAHSFASLRPARSLTAPLRHRPFDIAGPDTPSSDASWFQIVERDFGSSTSATNRKNI
jgi:hypothetical protein